MSPTRVTFYPASESASTRGQRTTLCDSAEASHRGRLPKKRYTGALCMAKSDFKWTDRFLGGFATQCGWREVVGCARRLRYRLST